MNYLNARCYYHVRKPLCTHAEESRDHDLLNRKIPRCMNELSLRNRNVPQYHLKWKLLFKSDLLEFLAVALWVKKLTQCL